MGGYIDDLSNSVYLGTARGKGTMYLDGEYPLTPQDGVLPFLNVFYVEGGLEVVGLWGREKREALLLRMKPDNISVDMSGREIEITFLHPVGALVVVVLYGNEGLARTLEGAVEACKKGGNVEGRLVSSRVSR
ncbi:hypothetical protein A3L11_04465 [Thermococcus siculi]|uniref:Uncharacterized protein n=1 Tax=Thermococcus siculi TaxID=72803 RepID=A0A2Z2MLK6_9EURY|nr:hypothetical protein A3L11_04465 [Thermococcus siculi]